MKRVLLLVATNLAVMLVASLAIHILGLNSWLSAQGVSYPQLLVWCAILGFGGAAVSLLMSKRMALWTTGARVVSGQEGPAERWLVETVGRLAQRAGIRPPTVAVYPGAPNAFATGAFRNHALVAVSTELMTNSLQLHEVEAVLAHEVAHVANGDMQTMGLLQGVLNTFVIFAARVVGTVVDRGLLKNEGRAGLGYSITVIVLELVFGLLASAVLLAYSRHREYRADWMAAELLGSARPMQSALLALERRTGLLPKPVKAFGVSGAGGRFALFKTHPTIEQRVRALQAFGR